MDQKNNFFSQFQFLGGILGLLIPILQLFVQLIPGFSSDVFLIKDNFLFISIFSAVVAYILIAVIRTGYPWFEIPISRKNHKKYQNFLFYTNGTIFRREDIDRFLTENPYVLRPFYFTPNNIFFILLPLTILSFLTFLYVGLLGASQNDINYLLIFIQTTSYIFLISSVTLLLAIYYIREINFQKFTANERSRITTVLKLAHDNNIFDEFPRVRLIAQLQSNDINRQHIFLFHVSNSYYTIRTDVDVNKIIYTEKSETMPDTINTAGGFI